MGALTRWIDASDLPGLMRLNPHAEVGVPLAPANKNQVLHGGAQEAFPWRGAALAVHLIRLASVLLGAGTVLCTYLLARTLLPDRPGIPLAAMAVSAFLPMFLFISASVNNDTLVTLLSSIALLMLVRLVQRGATPGQLVLLGVVIGLACLAKLGALGLLPLAALAIALRAFAPSSEGPAAGGEVLRRARLRWAVGAAALIFLPALAVAGWWYLRNLRLYGDVTGLNAMLEIAGRRGVAALRGATARRVPGLPDQLLGAVWGRQRTDAPCVDLYAAGRADGCGARRVGRMGSHPLAGAERSRLGPRWRFRRRGSVSCSWASSAGPRKRWPRRGG